jgi:hypothetical protein
MTEVVIGELALEAIEEVDAMLGRPIESGESGAAAAALTERLAAVSGGLLGLRPDAFGGHRTVATRAIAAGEVVLEEEAVAFFLSRSPGTDGVYVLTAAREEGATADAAAPIIAALPHWAALRTARDTFTLAPQYVGRAEEAYALLAQLSALGSTEHGRVGWADLATVPAGSEATTEDGASNDVPVRCQLLAAIAQCNAFAVRLPSEPEPESLESDAVAAETSQWRSALLYPLLARMGSADDRERLFDDEEPLSYVTTFFPAAAMINHSCAPSASFSGCSYEVGSEGPALRMVALRDIAEGEEVTIAYGYAEGEAQVEERRYKLLVSYRFACGCERCVAEEPRAGGAEDPLNVHFPAGSGLDGVRALYSRSGWAYPQ